MHASWVKSSVLVVAGVIVIIIGGKVAELCPRMPFAAAALGFS